MGRPSGGHGGGESPVSRDSISRREAIRRTLGAAGALALTGATWNAPGSAPREEADEYLAHALGAARWIASHRIETDSGVTWPVDPEEYPEETSATLYSGAPGVVLFLLELHRVTGDRAYLDEARAGADEIRALVQAESEELEDGLYMGRAGLAFVLSETHRATGEAVYREASRGLIRLLCARAERAGAGVQWNDFNDIIGGSAGIGLTLLQEHRQVGDTVALDTAAAAGRRLIERGEPAEGGLRWEMEPSWDRRYPNFSHGTAGVSYFLATLHEATGDPAFLDAARAGATYLDAVATHEHGGCTIFHHEPGGEDLYYLSWCHGPAGTARLYLRLAEITGESRWSDSVACLAQGIVAWGAPERRSPGYWNNISQCCGDAGVGEFFLSLHRRSPSETAYLGIARRAAARLMRQATEDPTSGGFKWVQAENRIQPEWVVPQTGFMQGAAGVGTFFLHMYDRAQGRTGGVHWPDSPFA